MHIFWDNRGVVDLGLSDGVLRVRYWDFLEGLFNDTTKCMYDMGCHSSEVAWSGFET